MATGGRKQEEKVMFERILATDFRNTKMWAIFRDFLDIAPYDSDRDIRGSMAMLTDEQLRNVVEKSREVEYAV